jgi:WhiB family transcriptional regulator, redox-sensing transcriptional regulator
VAARIRRSTEWMHDGACVGEDPALFFVTGAAADEARAICGRCEVREVCLDYALEEAIEFGTWGGLDWKQRRRRART